MVISQKELKLLGRVEKWITLSETDAVCGLVFDELKGLVALFGGAFWGL